MVNRFDLERKILEAWNHTEADIELVYYRYAESIGDKGANVLLGLAEMHEMRMQAVWEIFEELIKNGSLK